MISRYLRINLEYLSCCSTCTCAIIVKLFYMHFCDCLIYNKAFKLQIWTCVLISTHYITKKHVVSTHGVFVNYVREYIMRYELFIYSSVLFICIKWLRSILSPACLSCASLEHTINAPSPANTIYIWKYMFVMTSLFNLYINGRNCWRNKKWRKVLKDSVYFIWQVSIRKSSCSRNAHGTPKSGQLPPPCNHNFPQFQKSGNWSL